MSSGKNCVDRNLKSFDFRVGCTKIFLQSHLRDYDSAVHTLHTSTNEYYTDRKENKIFLIYKEIQNGAVEKSYLRKGFQIYEEMRKYFPMYEEAVSHIRLCNCSILNFLI
jgi:hypothetical protein